MMIKGGDGFSSHVKGRAIVPAAYSRFCGNNMYLTGWGPPKEDEGGHSLRQRRWEIWVVSPLPTSADRLMRGGVPGWAAEPLVVVLIVAVAIAAAVPATGGGRSVLLNSSSSCSRVVVVALAGVS